MKLMNGVLNRSVRLLLFMGVCSIPMNQATGALVLRQYDLANYSSDQDGAVLSGSFDLLIDTANGGVVDQGGGNYLLLPTIPGAVNIVSWNFTVNKPGELPYSASSTNNFSAITVAGSAFFSTGTNFSVSSSTTLVIGVNDPVLSQTFVSWDRASNSYSSAFQGNASPRGWNTSGPTSIALDSNNAWIVGQAVPEPSSALLLGLTAIPLLFRRRIVR